MLKKPPILQEILKGGARMRTGVVLLGWGFAATMSLLVAVSAYQNRAPDPFGARYAALVLPSAGDVRTTASIGNANKRPTEFGVFSAPSPVESPRPGQFEAQIDTLRHEIIALRRSADALRRQNDIMSDRLAQIEGGRTPSVQPPSGYATPSTSYDTSARYATNNRQQAVDPMITGSIGKAKKSRGTASAPRTKFAVDLGAYGSLEEVATAWHAMQATETRIIGSLLPLASIAEDANNKMVAHLVAGPFDNAADAAAACARLEKRLIECKPTLFAGQRLPAR
ncbi:sporulation related protein [Breoghania corrubedonensis]|uniref:Sporulation related protein n=1 Tax=Breoghania corrubedonensis TaxID=665038 RepID=A0A2T5V8C2_9HYPH|nr:SPOR domain-containing protein [Breoghania corrubedonensis]PTW60006.1 sporulation related protein [Breoghania corrubedonensis]